MKLSVRISKVQLEGTSPQVKWAAALRAKRVKELEEMGWKNVGMKFKDVMPISVLNKTGITTPERIHTYIKEIMFRAISETSSLWWIENRSKPTLDLVFEAHNKLINQITPEDWI